MTTIPVKRDYAILRCCDEKSNPGGNRFDRRMPVDVERCVGPWRPWWWGRRWWRHARRRRRWHARSGRRWWWISRRRRWWLSRRWIRRPHAIDVATVRSSIIVNRPGGGGFAGRAPSPRPAYGNLPTPGMRPGAGIGSRPNTGNIAGRPSGVRPGAGTRPPTGVRPGGGRPSTSNIAGRPGGTRPGAGTRPATGARPGAGTLPAVAGRPTGRPAHNYLDLPTMGGGYAGAARPTTRPVSPGAVVGGVLVGGAAAEFLHNFPSGGLSGTGARPGMGDIATTLPARPGGGIQPGAELRPGGERPGQGLRPGGERPGTSRPERPAERPDIGRPGQPGERPVDVGRPGRPAIARRHRSAGRPGDRPLRPGDGDVCEQSPGSYSRQGSMAGLGPGSPRRHSRLLARTCRRLR